MLKDFLKIFVYVTVSYEIHCNEYCFIRILLQFTRVTHICLQVLLIQRKYIYLLYKMYR